MMADEIIVVKCQSSENTQSKMPRTQLAVLGSNSKQYAETLKTYRQQNADETPEHRTAAVALTQPYSSEANQALLLEKYFTNCFAVDNGSEEIDQPMHSFGKRLDRRALGFKTCAMGWLASVNSSMISELSSNKQNLPLITERGAASFPFGPVRSVVTRTNCTGRPLCSVAWITFSRFREEFSMWLQITKWSGRSDYWHKWLNSVNAALCLWGICPSVSTHWAFREEMRSVPRTWCQSSTIAEPANFGMSCLTWIRDVWSADHKYDFTLGCSFAGVRSHGWKPKGSVTAGSPEVLEKEMLCATEALRNDMGQQPTMMMQQLAHLDRPQLWSPAVALKRRMMFQIRP